MWNNFNSFNLGVYRMKKHAEIRLRMSWQEKGVIENAAYAEGFGSKTTAFIRWVLQEYIKANAERLEKIAIFSAPIAKFKFKP
jgi:hypothetical protein